MASFPLFLVDFSLPVVPYFVCNSRRICCVHIADNHCLQTLFGSAFGRLSRSPFTAAKVKRLTTVFELCPFRAWSQSMVNQRME